MRDYLTFAAQHSPLHGFILANGREFVADKNTFKGRRMKAHMCYMNCTHRVLADDALIYVEGYVACHGVPIQHAWLLSGDKIIDPTLKNEKGHLDQYFGVPFSTKYLRKSILANGYYGLLDGYYARKTIADLIEDRADFKP